MIILSYILSISGLIAMICASLIKGERMKTILFLVCMGNLLVATNYLIYGSGINGAAACYLGGAMTLINYFFDSKSKKIPKWLTALYMLAIVTVNIWVAGGVTLLGLLVIAASIIFVLGIGETNGARYRFWTIINMILWCTYDVLSASYSALVTHVALLVFTVAGMIIHDRQK